MAGQKMRFKDLLIGDLFRFDHDYSKEITYEKTSISGYTLGNKRDYARALKREKGLAKIYNYPAPKALRPMKVGSRNTEVIRIRGKK